MKILYILFLIFAFVCALEAKRKGPFKPPIVGGGNLPLSQYVKIYNTPRGGKK